MIDRVETFNGKEISIAQDLSLSHAGTVWDGAIVLCYYWNKHPQIPNELFKNKRVLELGSGTGLVGVTASAYNSKKVYLTDLPEYLKILQINKNKNNHLSSHPDCLEVRKLEWGNQTDIAAVTDIDTLIGAELAYDKQNVILLMETIKHYRTVNPKLRVMIAYQRNKEEWKNLQVKFGQYFGKESFKLVQYEEFDQEYRDDHLGIIYI